MPGQLLFAHLKDHPKKQIHPLYYLVLECWMCGPTPATITFELGPQQGVPGRMPMRMNRWAPTTNGILNSVRFPSLPFHRIPIDHQTFQHLHHRAPLDGLDVR
jgi:hypothetical protein